MRSSAQACSSKRLIDRLRSRYCLRGGGADALHEGVELRNIGEILRVGLRVAGFDLIEHLCGPFAGERFAARDRREGRVRPADGLGEALHGLLAGQEGERPEGFLLVFGERADADRERPETLDLFAGRADR